jgi:hypothetical protein
MIMMTLNCVTANFIAWEACKFHNCSDLWLLNSC